MLQQVGSQTGAGKELGTLAGVYIQLDACLHSEHSV